MKIFLRYLKIWWIMSKDSFLMVLVQKSTLIIFLIGKVIRFVLFGMFLVFLLKGTNTLAGYNLNQTLFFFVTFTLVDSLSQFFFREVYRFRPQIVSGSFDLVLTKPISALFRSLAGGADVIDLITLPPLIYVIVYIGGMLHPTFIQIALYVLLVINGVLIAAAFHIMVLSLGILTTEIDHTIMIYRDLSSMGRFPVDIYKEPLKGTLTYLIPVAIMVTLPAKILMGLVSPTGVLISLAVGVIAVFIATRFWNYALRYYTSASS